MKCYIWFTSPPRLPSLAQPRVKISKPVNSTIVSALRTTNFVRILCPIWKFVCMWPCWNPWHKSLPWITVFSRIHLGMHIDRKMWCAAVSVQNPIACWCILPSQPFSLASGSLRSPKIISGQHPLDHEWVPHAQRRLQLSSSPQCGGSYDLVLHTTTCVLLKTSGGALY
jgi:hypothetical protein